MCVCEDGRRGVRGGEEGVPFKLTVEEGAGPRRKLISLYPKQSPDNKQKERSTSSTNTTHCVPHTHLHEGLQHCAAEACQVHARQQAPQAAQDAPPHLQRRAAAAGRHDAHQCRQQQVQLLLQRNTQGLWGEGFGFGVVCACVCWGSGEGRGAKQERGVSKAMQESEWEGALQLVCGTAHTVETAMPKSASLPSVPVPHLRTAPVD